MARIVFGICTSHGPMLSTPPDQWGQRIEADRANREHAFRGGTYDFDALVQLRASEDFAAQCTPEIWREKDRRNQVAIARLAEAYAEARPDVAVIVGNDQREIFGSENLPGVCVFWGESVDNIPATEAQKARMPPGIAVAELGHRPAERTTYACLPELGLHLIRSFCDEGFDVAQSTALPDAGIGFSSGIPHAFGFIYRQIMKDEVIPHVPIILNTFVAPNQPRAWRCYRLGEALGRALSAWDSDARVAVIGSGGLSHFVIDEAFDGEVIDAMCAGDGERLMALPEDRFRSGTSEIKNWLPAAAALIDAGFAMKMIDYVPCYRSAAGTGTAHGFAYWQAA